MLGSAAQRGYLQIHGLTGRSTICEFDDLRVAKLILATSGLPSIKIPPDD
jgi:hypothetical protein